MTQDGIENVRTLMNVYQTLVRLNIANTHFRSRPRLLAEALEGDPGPWQSFMVDDASVNASDDHTVVIMLKQKSAPSLVHISLFSNATLSADFFKDAPPAKLPNQLMGSGPYMLAEWKKGEQVVLKAIHTITRRASRGPGRSNCSTSDQSGVRDVNINARWRRNPGRGANQFLSRNS